MIKTRQPKKNKSFDIYSKPVTRDEIDALKSYFKSRHKNYLNYIAALFVLAAGTAYRVMGLDFETGVELFEVSVNIGLWIGLFTGFMANGERRIRVRIATVSIIVSASASVFAAMMMVLYLGYMESWFMSVNILASALGSMWVLIYYDGVIQGLESLKFVTEKQLLFVNRAAQHFEELDLFNQKIADQGRKPLTAEYWAILDWIHKKANANNS